MRAYEAQEAYSKALAALNNHSVTVLAIVPELLRLQIITLHKTGINSKKIHGKYRK